MFDSIAFAVARFYIQCHLPALSQFIALTLFPYFSHGYQQQAAGKYKAAKVCKAVPDMLVQ